MRDRRKLATLVVLGAWTALFAWLWLSDEVVRYLGPRTRWVVMFGTIALALVTLGQLTTLRRSEPRSLSLKEGLGLGVVLVPILVILAVPRAELGSLAVQRRSTGGGLIAAVERSAPTDLEDVSFREIQFASESTEYRRATGIVEGLPVKLVGFVSDSSDANFELARFYISCCAADAIPYAVPVDASALAVTRENDEWLEVSGVLEDRDGTLTVVADSVEEIPAPKDPYLF